VRRRTASRHPPRRFALPSPQARFPQHDADLGLRHRFLVSRFVLLLLVVAQLEANMYRQVTLGTRLPANESPKAS